jgi:RimJ/RimL family protein N-acetyltransferase
VGQVYLRALEISDLERTQKWHNDSGLYELLVSPFRFVSRSAEEEWIRKKTAFSQAEFQLAICLKEDNRHIGNIHLRNIDWVSRLAEVGLFIGDAENWSKGYGTCALRLIVRHAFRDLGLRRIFLTVLASNQRAVTCYEKCGFVVEGRLRRHAYKCGEFRDLIFMGLCAEDSGSGWAEQADGG